jgi:hypothetical protein
MTRILSLSSCSFVACLLACGESGGPVHAQEGVVSVQDDALELSLSVEPRTFAPGDTARLEIAVRNTGNRTLQLEAGGCPLLYYIEDTAGEVVVPGGGDWVCIMILQILELAPGEARERVETWAGASCPQVNPEQGCSPLPPGEYRVYATFRASEGGRDVFLRTPEVSVRVRG